MAAERWLPIPSYEGLYEASDFGRIRSLPRATTSGRILHPSPRDKNGRLKVSLSKNGKIKYCDVAVLVAITFIGPHLPGQQVRHGPAGVKDNSVTNLCYGSAKDNQRDRLRDGTWPSGELNTRARLTWKIADECRQRYENGERPTDLSREFGVTCSAISHIIHGRTWIR